VVGPIVLPLKIPEACSGHITPQ